MKVLNLLCR